MSSLEFGFQTLVLSGPATLYELAEIRESLQTAMKPGRDLRIDLGNAGPWDIAGLQLLISATVSGRQVGRSVRLTNVPKVCLDLAIRAGLSSWLNDVSETFS